MNELSSDDRCHHLLFNKCYLVDIYLVVVGSNLFPSTPTVVIENKIWIQCKTFIVFLIEWRKRRETNWNLKENKTAYSIDLLLSYDTRHSARYISFSSFCIIVTELIERQNLRCSEITLQSLHGPIDICISSIPWMIETRIIKLYVGCSRCELFN